MQPSASAVPSSSPSAATEAIEWAATNDLVAAWQARLPTTSGPARAGLMVTLAWHLRQRDPGQARRLAEEAAPLVADRWPLRGRLALVRGEQAVLAADFVGAQSHASEALELFARAGDEAGISDTHVLLATMEAELGHHAGRDAALARARGVAATDGLRLALVDAVIAFNAMVAGQGDSEPFWTSAMEGHIATGIPALVAAANDVRVVMAFRRGEYGLAIPWLRDQLEAARLCGLVRKQITTLNNLSMCFSMLNDHGTALEWAQASLDLARGAGWPGPLGAALRQMSQVLDCLDHGETAQSMLDEALAALTPLAGTQTHLAALVFKSRLALARGDAATALQTGDELARLSQGHYHQQFLFEVRFGRAQALMLLGRAAEAAHCAQQALETAESTEEPHAQIDALELLADLHDRFPLTPPAPLQAASAPLNYLGLALDVATAIPSLRVPGRLFELLAAQHAKAGENAQAYARSLDAAAAREATHGREVRDRAMAAQLHHEAERARAELEHVKRLSDIEAERARALERAYSELRATQDELLKRNQVQARMNSEREETLAFLAHDLRAPLAALAAALQGFAPDEAGRRAERLAERALTMTDRFLAVARLSHLPAADRVPLDLASVVDAACETFERRALDEGRVLDQQLVFGIAIAGHRETLVRAICNLVDNALTHSGDGGRVEVSMATREDEAAVVVADNGPGMPAAARQVLLRSGGERSAFAGGRLGLAIVAEVAKVHEARIEVDAGAQGTRIALWLPRAGA